MLKMTPRRATQAKEKKESPSNPERKVFDFSNKAEEAKKEDNGGLSAEELEKLLLERTDELDELKEKFEAIDAENDELRADIAEMQEQLDEA